MPLTPSVPLHSPALVRELAALGPSAPPPARASLAERLGSCLGWTDAIALAGVLDAPAPPTRRASAFDAAAALAQAREALVQAIDGLPDPGDHAATDATERLRRHRELQQAMEARLGPLRAQLRAALASRSPAGARLAALDAVLEQALALRWREALAAVPGWGRRHGDDAAAHRRLLHAELDLRLQPLQGLAEALS